VGFRDELVVFSHDEMAGAASDVDAMTGVGGVAEDTLVRFVRRPRIPCELASARAA
jgi:hypothetical protein